MTHQGSEPFSQSGDATPRQPLTYLFVPAHEEGKVTRALQSGTDAVILDLQDSVPDGEKDAARRAIRNRFSAARVGKSPAVWVRVNCVARELAADLATVNWEGVDGAVVPVAEDPGVCRCLEESGARQLIPLIETVAGFSALSELARVRAVVRFAIGTFDLALDLGLWAVADPDDSELMWQLRGSLVFESRRLGLPPPVDGIYAHLNNEAGLRVVCERALRLGYGGKLIIHPKQIAVVKSVFEASSQELQFAREVVEAYERASLAGRGAIQVRGHAVDRPMMERARGLLARWAGKTNHDF